MYIPLMQRPRSNAFMSCTPEVCKSTKYDLHGRSFFRGETGKSERRQKQDSRRFGRRVSISS